MLYFEIGSELTPKALDRSIIGSGFREKDFDRYLAIDRVRAVKY
jgi:hypothetical protein